LAMALIVAGALALLREWLPLPPWITRNLFSAVFTLVIAAIGVSVMARAAKGL
jgi:multisubunit Na+/H+ antiporter MnhG subunit